MKKILIFLFLTQCLLAPLLGQQFPGEINVSQLPILSGHFQDEYTQDNVVNPQAWKNQQNMHAAFGSTDKLYFRREVPTSGKETTQLKQTVWKGERANIQILIWSADTLNQVRLKLNNLKTTDGKILNAENGQFNLVRYVLSNYPYAAKDVVCGNSPYPNGYLMPDRFESFERFQVPGNTLRPVWLTLDVPEKTEAGTYSGTIEIKSDKQTLPLNVSIEVQNQVLPQPSKWKHRLDLWQNPWVVAWRNQVKPWSIEHKTLLKQHLKLYADAGGKYITTYAVHSPWADNSYMIEGGMIEWIKQKDGHWKFDYSIFDEYVELAMECGITQAITLYTAIPWGNRFRYMDEASGNYVHAFWAPEKQEFTTHWNIFLTDLKKHLTQKGWLNIAYLGINENEMSQTLAAIKVIKAHSKDWRITYAGNWHKELDGLLDDYSFLYGQESTPKEVSDRKARGASTTFYVCCNPPYPNNFVFSPPIEGRWISWYSAAFGYDGFLRWAYDAWTEDPIRDARHGTWAAGDCFLMYPGGNSCIRFEKLREGIVDFEKIHILREKAALSSNASVRKTWTEFENHLKVFIKERTFDETKITTDVDKGKEMINQLSTQLGQ